MAGRPKLGKHSVTGNLVDDPVQRDLDTGTLTTFRLADTPRVFDRGASEWKDGDTVFYDIAVKNARLGENIRESVGKGDRLAVSGNYESVPYVTKNNEPGLNHRIWADDVSASLDYATVEVKPNPRIETPNRSTPSVEPVPVEASRDEPAADMAR